MWENVAGGDPEFRVNGWRLVARVSGQGLILVACRDPWVAAAARIFVPGVPLDRCEQWYVRGDGLHLACTGRDRQCVVLEVELLPIEAERDRFVLESVISMRTSLLESHPAIELQVGAGHPGFPRWGGNRWHQTAEFGAALWLQAQPGPPLEGPRPLTGVVCGERDRASLDAAALGDGQLRFFGDFLEKGVIRKVQPWWVWSCGPPPGDLASNVADQLAARPLPLAS